MTQPVGLLVAVLGLRDRIVRIVGAAAQSYPKVANGGSLPGVEASESHQLVTRVCSKFEVGVKWRMEVPGLT